MGVGKGGEYRAVLADLNTKGRNCSLNKFGNNFHFYFLDLKYVAGCFYSFHWNEPDLWIRKKRKMITTQKCKMLCWDKVFLKMGEEDLRVITNTVRLVSAGVCCSYFTICRSSRSWKSSDKKWLLSDYCCKLRQEFIQFLWTILKINSKWFERRTIGLCSLKCTLVMSQFSLILCWYHLFWEKWPTVMKAIKFY